MMQVAVTILLSFACVASADRPGAAKKLLRDKPRDSGCGKPCTREFNPQCGTNGLVYDNPCLFEIAQCKLPHLQLDLKGESCAQPNSSATEPDDCSRMCDLRFEPVCGSDGTIHANTCIFEIHKCKKAPEQVTHQPLHVCGWHQDAPTDAPTEDNGPVSVVRGFASSSAADNGIRVQNAVQGAQIAVQSAQGAYDTFKNIFGDEVLNKTKNALHGGNPLLESGALLSVVVDEFVNAPALRIKPLTTDQVAVLDRIDGAGDSVTIPLPDDEDPDSVEESWSALIRSLQSSVQGFKQSFNGAFKRQWGSIDGRPIACPEGCIKWTDGCTVCDCNLPLGGVKECDDVQCVWQGIPKCLEWRTTEATDDAADEAV